MTRMLLTPLAVAAMLAAASAPALGQGTFQGGVSVSAGDIDNAPAVRKRAKVQAPAQPRPKRKPPPYTNRFHCIPSGCPAGGSATGR